MPPTRYVSPNTHVALSAALGSHELHLSHSIIPQRAGLEQFVAPRQPADIAHCCTNRKQSAQPNLALQLFELQ